MRTIKFRVWDKTANEMLYFTDIWNHRKPFTEKSTFPQYDSCPEYHDLSHPMLFTGLKDKNGIEIYEGDKVNRKNSYSNDITTHEVFYNVNTSSYQLSGIDELGLVLGFEYKVIGNIYEENKKCVRCKVLLTNTADIICADCKNLATLNIEKPHNTNSNKCWCNPTIINPLESEAQNEKN